MRKLIYLFLSAIILFTACDYYNSNVNNENEQSTVKNIDPVLVNSNNAVYSGSGLTLSMRPPETLNPLINNDESVDNILKLLFEPVCEVRENMRPMPNLLSRMEFDAEGKSVFCVIREDMLWADGVKLNSSDIKFSVDVLQGNNGSLIYKDIVSDIESVDIVDNASFRVRFSKPQGGISYGLCFPVIPRHYYSGNLDVDDWQSMSPLGNGIYKAEEIKNVKEINLSINENSFRNKPYLESVKIYIIDDKETMFQAFDQSIIDAIDTDSMSFGKYSGSKNSSIWPYDTNYYTFLGFNFKNLLFEDKRVREAIAYSIDKANATSSIYLEKGRMAFSVINSSSFLFEPAVKSFEFNLDNTKNSLFQAGFRDNNLDGILDIEVAGITRRLEFKLLVNEESAERMKIAQSIKDNLEKLGLIINISSCDFESFQARLLSGDYDIVLGAYNFSLKPDFRFMYHSESEGNFLNYRSEVMDKLILDSENARTESELKKAVSDIQKHIASELPCVSIIFVQRALLTDSGLKGDKRPVLNNIYSNIAQWRIE